MKILSQLIVIQARNQEFFRAAEFSWNQGTSINIHLQHEKLKAPQGKNLQFFCLETLKNFILKGKVYPQGCDHNTAFFLQIRALFFNFRKRAGETSPPSPLQLRACNPNPSSTGREFFIKLKTFAIEKLQKLSNGSLKQVT